MNCYHIFLVLCSLISVHVIYCSETTASYTLEEFASQQPNYSITCYNTSELHDDIKSAIHAFLNKHRYYDVTYEAWVWDSIFEDSKYKHVVITDKCNELQGIITTTQETNNQLIIAAFATIPRQGFGGALLSFIANAEPLDTNTTLWSLKVEKHNIAAQNAYKKLGFLEGSAEEDYIEFTGNPQHFRLPNQCSGILSTYRDHLRIEVVANKATIILPKPSSHIALKYIAHTYAPIGTLILASLVPMYCIRQKTLYTKRGSFLSTAHIVTLSMLHYGAYQYSKRRQLAITH